MILCSCSGQWSYIDKKAIQTPNTYVSNAPQFLNKFLEEGGGGDIHIFKIYKIQTDFQKLLSMYFYQQKVVYI